MFFALAMQVVGGFILLYFVCLIGASVVLVISLNSMNRGMMLPWMVMFGLGLVFQLIFGLWLIGGYYIYVSFVFFFVIVLVTVLLFVVGVCFIRVN